MTCDLWLFLPGPGLGCSKMGFRFGVFVTAGGTNQSERTRVISSSVCEQVFLPYLIPLWFWFFSRLIIPSLISFLLCSAPPLPHDPHFLLFVRLFSFFSKGTFMLCLSVQRDLCSSAVQALAELPVSTCLSSRISVKKTQQHCSCVRIRGWKDKI